MTTGTLSLGRDWMRGECGIRPEATRIITTRPCCSNWNTVKGTQYTYNTHYSIYASNPQRLHDFVKSHAYNYMGHSKKFYLSLFYVLGTSTVISGQVPTCDSAHSYWIYSAGPLEDQATSTITWYPMHSHYPDTEPTSPYPNLIMAERLARKQQVYILKSLVSLDQGSAIQSGSYIPLFWDGNPKWKRSK